MNFRNITRFLAVLAACALGATAQARDNYLTSVTTPYPPGCVSSNNSGLITPTFGRQVYGDDTVNFRDADGGSDVPANLQIFRRGCIEDNRSVLFVTIEPFQANRRIAVPRVFLLQGETRYPMRLTPEANTFEVNHSGLFVGPGTYPFIVDGPAEQSVNQNTPLIDPETYSGAVTIIIQDALDSNLEYSVPLPTWTGDIRPQAYPLNGRLSGPWVSEGAEEQGFVLSFDEFWGNPENPQLLAFFSWYTYDQDGNPLWLASSATFPVNASSVNLPMSLRTGEFLGAPGTPTDLPNATLTAVSCGELTLDYDLTALGLGAGTLTLTRIFALETAGYACRDLQGRLDELQSQ